MILKKIFRQFETVKKCISRFFEVLTSCLEQVRQSVLTENFKYFRAQKFLTKKAKMLIRNQDNPNFLQTVFKTKSILILKYMIISRQIYCYYFDFLTLDNLTSFSSWFYFEFSVTFLEQNFSSTRKRLKKTITNK